MSRFSYVLDYLCPIIGFNLIQRQFLTVGKGNESRARAVPGKGRPTYAGARSG